MWISNAAARACALAVAAMILLAGCTDRSLSQDARFDATSTSGSEAKGLIVVGVRIAREPVRHSWLIGDVRQHPWYVVWLGAINDAGRLGRSPQQVTVCEPFRSSSSGLLSDCDPGRMRYKVLAVPPGQYAIGGIEYTADRVTSITTYARRPQLTRSTEAGVFPSGGARNAERSLTVRAGEIVYAGDLNFDFEPRQPFASLRVSRDDERARAALAGYPNIHGDLVFRSIAGAGVERVASQF